MLEWSICSDCGTILDKSQETCQNCHTDVEKIHMDYLVRYFNNLKFIVKTASVFKPYIENLKDISIETAIIDDLFRYFSYLGLGDGKITEVIMENALEVEVPDTLSSRSVLLLFIGMFDIALGIGILLYVKKNKATE